MGESGSCASSSASIGANGPSSGRAGETGLLPGIGASLVLLDLECVNCSCCCSSVPIAPDVSQSLNSFCGLEISIEASLAE